MSGTPRLRSLVTAAAAPRSARLRAPLLVLLGGLLLVEAAGGLVVFIARLASGHTPGESLHVVAGALLTLVYAAYQWQHWGRVEPWRSSRHAAKQCLKRTWACSPCPMATSTWHA